VIFSQRVGNAQAAIEALIVRACAGAVSVRWALDMTSGTAALLIALLHSGGQQVCYVPGKLVNRMSGAFAGEGKTDAKDAKTIAETARLRTDLTAITPSDRLIVDLQVLTSRRDDLKADWVRGVNRLRALLAGFFPALEGALDYSTRSPLILLIGFQTPSGLRIAGPDAIRDFLLEHRAFAKTTPTIVGKAIAAAEQTIAVATEAVSAPLVARLAGDLLDLDRQINDLDKQISERFGEHRHAKRITSVIGFGPVLGAALLADTGGDPQRMFKTPARLAAYAGLAPVPATPGEYAGTCTAPSATTAGYDMSSIWPRSPRSPSTDHRKCSTDANAQKGNATSKQSSPSPAASSTSSGHCYAMNASSSSPHRPAPPPPGGGVAAAAISPSARRR